MKSERRVNGFRFMLEFLFCTAAATTLTSSLDPTQFEFFPSFVRLWFYCSEFCLALIFSSMFCPADKTWWPIFQLASFGTCVMSAINLD